MDVGSRPSVGGQRLSVEGSLIAPAQVRTELQHRF